MRNVRRYCALLAFAAVLLAAAVSHAAFHEWAIKEIFTSADGTVQFVELFTAAPAENFIMGHNIVITSDGVEVTIPFDHDLVGSTANKHLLVATSNFGSLAGGVAPDFTPTSGNLFNPNAANIKFNFAHDFDILELSGSQIPKNGVSSLTDSDTSLFGPDILSVTTNSPTNYAGASGSVNTGGGTAAPGDFNGSGTVNGADLTIWRNNFGLTPATVMQGNADGDADVDGSDFLVWQRNVSPAPVTAIPEPTALAIAAMAAAAVCLAAPYATARVRRRT